MTRTVVPMAAEVDDLRTVAPQDFVAARNAAVKALRADGRREEAAALAALRRPSAPDWALNTVAVRSPRVVATVVAAAERLRGVQERALGDPNLTPELRGALAEIRKAAGALRSAAEEVLRAAGRPSSDVGALASRVNETVVNPMLLDQLQAGRLGTAPVDSVEPFADLQGGSARPRRPSKDRASAAVPRSDAAAEPGARSTTKRAAADERRRDEAAGRLEAAEESLAAARRLLDEASAGLAAAKQSEERARGGLEDAERRRDRAAVQLGATEAAFASRKD